MGHGRKTPAPNWRSEIYEPRPAVSIDEAIDNILKGIDKTEGEHENGWWETSTGAEFGAAVKEEVKKYIHTREEDLEKIVIEAIGPIPRGVYKFPSYWEKEKHYVRVGTQAGILDKFKKLKEKLLP